MKKLLATIALAASLIGPAHAKEDHYAIMGMGARTCTQFAQDYRRNPNENELAYFIWAQGYMSALNTAMQLTGEDGKDLNSLPLKQQQWIIRDYCNDHPLALYDQALLGLYDQFSNMPPTKAKTE